MKKILAVITLTGSTMTAFAANFETLVNEYGYIGPLLFINHA